MRQSPLSIGELYAWALLVFLGSLVASWCLGRAVQGDDMTGAFALFVACLACVLWLVHLRREIQR